MFSQTIGLYHVCRFYQNLWNVLLLWGSPIFSPKTPSSALTNQLIVVVTPPNLCFFNVLLINELTLAKTRNLSTCVILLDISAAFDTVDHSSLIDRLSKRYGFSDLTLDWFISYLADRAQRVCVNGSLSDWYSVRQCVPQGSVLGPILYSLYWSPVFDIIDSYGLSCHIYADDIVIFTSYSAANFSNALSTLRQCSLHLCDWFNSNKLKLNLNKSNVLFCTSNSCAPLDSLLIGDVLVPSTCVTNYLGVTLDDSLSLNQHVSRVTRLSFAKDFRYYKDCQLW